MLNSLTNLPEDPAELRQVSELLAAEVKALTLKVEQLQHQLHGANRHRFGSKSESMDQLQLFVENEEIAKFATEAEQTPPAEPVEPKGKSKRKPLPDHLDRIEQVLSIGEDCPECGGDLSKLGEDVTCELEYIPGRFVVNKIIRPRMSCRRCEAISQAPLPSRPIERGRPGPGLLAHVLVSKYADHLPLYRQSQIYAREGVDLDRSTMADWVGKSTALLEPLAEAIAKRVKDGAALFADDTPLKMLAPGNKRPKQRVSGPMSGMSDHGPANRRHALGISLRLIARVSIRLNTCQAIRAGCRPMDMPVSTVCLVKAKPRKWPAWPISGANLWMCLPRKVLPSPKKPSSELRNCMAWKNRQGANLPRPVSLCVKKMQSSSSMIWRYGCATNCPKYRVNHL